MSRDRIYVLEPEFEDRKLSEKRYFCPHSNQIEGVFASFPILHDKVEVVRLAFPRPRQAVIDLIGEQNQSLPVLVFGTHIAAPADAKSFGTAHFVNDTRRILELLAERHGIPWPH